jgi:hypothetical protein
VNYGHKPASTVLLDVWQVGLLTRPQLSGTLTRICAGGTRLGFQKVKNDG